jgi:hypothetical protein
MERIWWGLLLLAFAAAGCSDERSIVAPAPAIQPGPASPPPGNPAPAQSSGPAAGTYASAAALHRPVTWYTLGSRFVLREDGSFVLQYPHVEYRGTYSAHEGTIDFAWEGWSTAGPWGATGTLSGTTLTVRYNLVMQLSDFEDAVYTRMP